MSRGSVHKIAVEIACAIIVALLLYMFVSALCDKGYCPW